MIDFTDQTTDQLDRGKEYCQKFIIDGLNNYCHTGYGFLLQYINRELARRAAQTDGEDKSQ